MAFIPRDGRRLVVIMLSFSVFSASSGVAHLR